MYVLLFDKMIDKRKSSEVVAAHYFKSSGSLLWDLLSTGTLDLTEVRFAVTDSLAFPIAWYILGKRPTYDTESERQLEVILPAATDGKITRVRGRSKPVRKVKKIRKRGISVSNIAMLDVDSLSEHERLAAILWTARTQAFLRGSTIAWRKNGGIYTVDPVTRELIVVKPTKEIKLAEEWLRWWNNVPVEKRVYSPTETSSQKHGKSMVDNDQ